MVHPADNMTAHRSQMVPRNVLVLQPSEEDSMTRALEFVEGVLTEADVPLKLVMKMNIVVDEIFSNIIYYSEASRAEIECCVQNHHVTLVFMDNGKPYNPLEADEPDTGLAAEDRKIGGLGIFMVKKTMDTVTYAYQEGQNVLTLDKVYE